MLDSPQLILRCQGRPLTSTINPNNGNCPMRQITTVNTLQAKPLQYNWRFLDLLQSPTKFGTVQALAGQSMERGTKMRTDRISTRTLNSVLIHNPESVDSAKWFSKDYNLTWGQNLVKKYFDMIDLTEWMDERQEVRHSIKFHLESWKSGKI